MRQNETGFTIIELMIATAVFTIILLITTTTIIGVSQTYVKGSVEDQTQQSAREILSDITEDVEFNNSSSFSLPQQSTNTPDLYFFCIGGDVYTYQLDKYLSSSLTGSQYSSLGLVRYPSTTCPTASTVTATIPAGIGAEELLATNERLGQLDIINSNNGYDAYTIDVEIAYGQNDLLNDTSANNGNYVNGLINSAPVNYKYTYSCSTGPDSSFCAVSALTATVQPRLYNTSTQ